MLSDLSFARPELLLLLALVPGAVALFMRAARKRREALALFLGGPGAEARSPASSVRAALQSAALALVIVALAGPRAGIAVTESRRAGLDLVVALDVSASMTAEDVPPSRLERARFVLARLAETRTTDRLALVVYAGEAALLSPLTRDAAAFRLFLDAAGPDIVGSAGSEPARALEMAAAAFGGETEGSRPRAVLLVGDGENPNLDGDDDEAALVARAMERAGIDVLALAVGSAEGAPIPLPSGRVKRDRAGDVVITRLDAPALRALAGDATFDVSDDAIGELDERLDDIASASAGVERVPTAAERYQWPLGAALLLLLLDRLVALAPRRVAGTTSRLSGVQADPLLA